MGWPGGHPMTRTGTRLARQDELGLGLVARRGGADERPRSSRPSHVAFGPASVLTARPELSKTRRAQSRRPGAPTDSETAVRNGFGQAATVTARLTGGRSSMPTVGEALVYLMA